MRIPQLILVKLKLIFYLRIFLLPVILLIGSCSQETGFNRNIPYTPYVPEGYQLINLQGVDSYVGSVENGEITFLFDYGMHSGWGPWSKRSLLEALILNAQFESIVADCGFNDNLEQVQQNIIIDSVYLNPKYPNESSNRMIVLYEYDNLTCEDELFVNDPRILDQIYQYAFEEDEDQDNRFKIFYPVIDSLNYAGISIQRKKGY